MIFAAWDDPAVITALSAALVAVLTGIYNLVQLILHKGDPTAHS